MNNNSYNYYITSIVIIMVLYSIYSTSNYTVIRINALLLSFLFNIHFYFQLRVLPNSSIQILLVNFEVLTKIVKKKTLQVKAMNKTKNKFQHRKIKTIRKDEGGILEPEDELV